jgi:DNA-directed RNA polymerase subunit RPC12/RpoP
MVERDEIPEPDKLISKELKNRDIEIIGFSGERNDLKEFSKYEDNFDGLIIGNEVGYKLFSFLIENLMNRYLFNLMMRNSPNIESWAINDEYLTEKSLEKYTFGQSFIKLYKCYDCKYFLKRIYAPELSAIPSGEIAECPNCGLKKVINPKDYESDFRIIKNDLANFTKKLRDIGVLHPKEYIQCSKCGVELGAKDELSGLKECRCGGKIIPKKRDEFKDDFLKLCESERGLWFEWFVYEVAKRIYDHVENGLNLSYSDDEGEGKEKEVDIVALNGDKLILIECKNYIGHTPPSQYETIRDIAPFFDEVYVVNFYKPHKDVIKKMIEPDSNIKVLNGSDIDDVFLDTELIISQLLTADTWFGTEMIAGLSNDKKISVIKQIFEDTEYGNMYKALIKIIDSGSIDSNLWWTNFLDDLKNMLKIQLHFISKVEKSREDITDRLKLVASYYHNFDKEQLSNILNPAQMLDSIAGVNKLAENYDSQIRKIYDRMFNLYDINDFDLSIIDNDILFDRIFDDLYHSYFENYNWSERVFTLRWIEFIFEKIHDTKVRLFSQLIEREFKTPDFHSGTVADWMFKIFSKYEHKFGDPQIIYNSAKYLDENGINNFVKSSAKLFVEKYPEYE